MNTQDKKHFDVQEEFDCDYLLQQIFNFKKWIFVSTALFFLMGSIYSYFAPRVWQTQIRIHTPNQQNLNQIYHLNHELTKLIYGFDKFSSEQILNEFAKFIENNQTNLKIRKDLDKTFLIELNTQDPVHADAEILSLLEEQNKIFLKKYLAESFEYIKTHIQDEDNLIKDQSLIQINLKAFLIENYIYRLNFMKSFSAVFHNPDITHEYLNDSIDRLLVYGNGYFEQNYADLYSKNYVNQESEMMRRTLVKVKSMMAEPVEAKAYDLMNSSPRATQLSSPNVPVILILSAVLGFTIGLFGVLLFLSSSPIIRKK